MEDSEPPTVPVAPNCADPVYTGALVGPNPSRTTNAWAAIVWSSDAATKGPEAEGACGRLNSTGRGLPSLPNRLNRVCAGAVPFATSVNVVVQFSAVAVCGSDPANSFRQWTLPVVGP